MLFLATINKKNKKQTLFLFIPGRDVLLTGLFPLGVHGRHGGRQWWYLLNNYRKEGGGGDSRKNELMQFKAVLSSLFLDFASLSTCSFILVMYTFLISKGV